MSLKQSTPSKISCVIVFLMCFVGQAAASTVEQYLQEANAKAKQGDLTSAAVLYQKAIKLDENNVKARKALASLLIKAKMQDPEAEHSEAELAIMEIAQYSHPWAHYHFNLSVVNNAALGPDDKHLRLDALRALTLLQKGDPDSAIQTANVLKKKNPHHPVAHNLLGLAWIAKGDIKRARTHYEDALSLKEDFNAARINLAQLEIQAQNYSKARAHLDRVISADQYNRQACLVLATLCDIEGKSAERRAWIRQVSYRY